LARAALALLPVVGLAAGCGKVADGWPDKPGKRVMVSFAPLYCFAANVAGDDAVVQCLLFDQGPHEYDYKPQDAVRLHRADLFLINGLGLDEKFAATLKGNASNGKLPIVEVGECIPQNQLRKPLESADAADAKDDGHHHGDIDPHVWLGLPQAILMVDRIRDELKKIDPAHAAGYDQRATAYKEKLSKILADAKDRLSKKTEKQLVTFHDSLQYFAAALGLTIENSLQAHPDEEPNQQRLAKLVERCLEPTLREKPEPAIRIIAVEPGQQSNPAARTLLRELQVKLKERRKKLQEEGKTLAEAERIAPEPEIVEIDVLEEAAENDLTPELYERKMRDNIDRLVKALK
jgi:ABC-type Zn uptake system ZnuABC Zn-binding protein ZnuA